MFDGLAGRGLVRDVRGLADAMGVTIASPPPADDDRAVASTQRPTDASPAAVVRLSSDGIDAMQRLRTQTHSEQELEAEFRERDTVDETDVSMEVDVYGTGLDPPPRPESLQPDRPPATTSSVLSRYLQVSRDPTAAMSATEDPRMGG